MNKLFILLIVFCLSCSSDYSRLHKALKISGKNRQELEKVLCHYSKYDADSLKLRAAKFLIENMPGHYTLQGKDIETYIAQFDSINPNLPLYMKSYLYTFPLTSEDIILSSEKIYDIENITSDFLIKNIDFKFKLLEVTPWGKDIPFEDFCEYILPYRLDIEPLKEVKQNVYNEIIDKLKLGIDYLKYCNRSTYILRDDIAEQVFNLDTNNLIFTGDELSFINGCFAKSHIQTELYRHIGIPAMIDFTPQWANLNGRHNWCNINDITYNNTYTLYLYKSKIAKVYRKTYSHNKCPDVDKNMIPDVFNPFHKDVTNKYVKTANILVDYKDCLNLNIKNVYLSVFDNFKWQPVAWSVINRKGNAFFEQLGKDIVYLPIYYKENDAIIADYPFILNNNEAIEKLIPDYDNKIKLHIERKFPLEAYKLKWRKNIIGAVVEASQNRDFTNSDTVCIIKDVTPNSIYTIPVDSLKKYRYVRIVQNPQNGRMLLSEFSCKDNVENEINGELFIPSPAQQLFYDPDLVYDTKQSELKSILSNKEYVNYATIPTWVGIDFGKQINVSSIIIGLRSDCNYIYQNDTYELLYHNNKGWVSLSIKKAGNDYIEFENVPYGALYWLRNLTEGKEERIFTYENGKMKFW